MPYCSAGSDSLRAQHITRIESGWNALQRERALNQERRARQQQQREGQLADDERRAQPIPDAAGGGAASRAAKAGLYFRPRGAHGRREAEDERAQKRHADREQDDEAVEPRLLETRHARRTHGHQRADADLRERESEQRGRQREHQALGQQLTDDPGAPRAERRADRQFTRARRAAGEQQVGEVAARDQQHEPHRAEQHEEPRPVVADDIVGHRDHLKPSPCVSFGNCAWMPGTMRAELAEGLLSRHAGLEAAEDGEVVLVVRGLALPP